jgi:WD40 repeat protein
MAVSEREESRVANWVSKAVLCSTMAVFAGGCGRVARPGGNSIDESNDTAGAGGASTGPAGTAGRAAIGPFTAWSTCQTLTPLRAARAPHALAASADLQWLAMLDSPLHYEGDPAPAGESEFQSVALWNLPVSTAALQITKVAFAFDVDLSPDGALVAISGDGAQVMTTGGSGVQPLSDGQVVWRYPPPPDVPVDGSWVRNFAFSPDGTLLASGRYHDLELLRADSGASVDKLVSQLSSPGVAFSPDGLYFASSTPSLWKVADATAVWAPLVSDPNATCEAACVTDNWAAFSPDASSLLTQSTIRNDLTNNDLTWHTTTSLLDAASGTALRSFRRDLPRRPTFSPDGRWILAGDRLIDVKTGQESPLGVPAVISLFLSDGRIAVADASGAVSLLCPSPP